MFEAISSNVKTIRDSIDTTAQIIDEANLSIKKDGIELIATDRAMVAVVDFKIYSSAFEKYSCESEEVIGLNLISFLSVLKRASPSDKLILKLSDDKSKLEVIFEGKSRRSFSIPLLNISKEDIPPINQFTFKASAVIDAGIFSQGIDDADIIADSVVIALDKDKFKMYADGNGSKAELVIEKGSEDLHEINSDGLIKSRYPIEYLKKMLKASKIADRVKIQLGSDYPMKMDFDGKNAKMSFVLAPRVSEEK